MQNGPLPFQIQSISLSDFKTSLGPDELGIFISKSSGPSKALKEVLSLAVPNLERNTHYLKIHAGFLNAPTGLWLAPVFAKPGTSALERRWVFHSWIKSLQSSYAPRKIAIFLDDDCATEDLVRVEDILTAFTDPLYTKSKWTHVRVCSQASNTVTKSDPHYLDRFKHQLKFRAWVNENPDSLTSIEIGDRLREFANNHGCTFTSMQESALHDENMNLLLAVGQGAKKSPSRLHILTKNLQPGVAPLALIGKGITFDTGGINLKPHESFVNCMKNDMGGAGLMSQLFMGLIETGYDKPIVLAIPACENAIDSRSMKPGVVIKSRKGKSVIIEHTDAEGRLILADAMSYISDTFKPHHMYTAATLTTASLRQFTNFFTPVHFATPEFKSRLEASAAKFGEAFTFWDEFLPFKCGNDTNAADLTNMGRMPSHASMGGGSNVAAHFLKEFADSPFTHIDIFNSIWNWSGDYPGAHYGCTGAVFNSLWDTFKSH